jgi:hypothetical protein
MKCKRIIAETQKGMRRISGIEGGTEGGRGGRKGR